MAGTGFLESASSVLTGIDALGFGAELELEGWGWW